MANDHDNTLDPNPQGSDDDGGKEKLYAGKYKTVDELVKGYQEAEKSLHSSRQDTKEELQELRELIETKLPEASDQGDGRQSGGDGVDENTKILGDFYSNPKAFRESIKQELKQELVNEESRKSSNRQVVEEWSQENPDIAENHDMIEYYVARTDPKLSPRKRLDVAAKKVRERLIVLRGSSNDDDGPNDGDHVEGPSGGNPPSGKVKSKGKPRIEDPESELKKHIAVQNASRKRTPPTHVKE